MRKDGIIRGLTNKIDELESKVNVYTNEVSILKLDKQKLEVEYGALKSTSVKDTNTRMDLSNLFKGQKPNDKSGLGYKKYNFLKSNNLGSPKAKGKQTQNYRGTNENGKMVRNAPNHAYRYRYNLGRNYNYKAPIKFENSKWSKNVYYKDANGWRYEVKGKTSTQIGSQQNEIPRVVSQQKLNRNKQNEDKNENGMTQAQILKLDYYNRFAKTKTNPPTSVKCNYCGNHGHITLDCIYRKKGNANRVVWIPKTKV
jgi:hypothetical protein